MVQLHSPQVSTSTSLSAGKQQGITHLILLIVVIVVLIAIIILVFLGLQASKTLNLKPDQNTSYQNPFEKSSQYQNPFETYQNPFDQTTQ